MSGRAEPTLNIVRSLSESTPQLHRTNMDAPVLSLVRWILPEESIIAVSSPRKVK